MNHRIRIKRRDFLGAALGAALGASVTGLNVLTGCGNINSKRFEQSSEKLLCIQSWADYMHPDVIPEFERRYGIHVVYDTISSNEGLIAKMQAGSSNYDLVVPTGYAVRLLKKMGQLSEIDIERLPNFKNLMPRFRNLLFDPNCQHSISYAWGTTGIGYNINAFADRGSLPTDWDVLFDEKFAGRMTLLDDTRETLGMALKRRGHSYNTINSSLVKEACQDLIEEKKLVMAYTSDQVLLNLASGDSLVSHVWSGDCYQAQKSNPDVRYIVPKNGTSMWVDSWCIPKGAPHLENAYLWINFMLEPEIAAKTANYIRYATPNAGALKLIDPILREDKNIYLTECVFDKCEEIADIGPAMFFYDRMWTELKCAN